MDLWIGEAQAGDALTVAADRSFDRLEGGFGEHAVVAETLDAEQAPVFSDRGACDRRRPSASVVLPWQ